MRGLPRPKSALWASQPKLSVVGLKPGDMITPDCRNLASLALWGMPDWTDPKLPQQFPVHNVSGDQTGIVLAVHLDRILVLFGQRFGWCQESWVNLL